MPTTRSYRDACGIARGLDVLGERWALLVVRELLLTSQRFRDLRRALPGVSSNLLTDRLRELETHKVVTRQVLATGAAVYELTASGRELEPVVLALGAWGLRVPMPTTPTLSPTSVLLYLIGSYHPDPATPQQTYAMDLGDRIWTITAGEGQLHVTAGAPDRAVARIRTDPATLNTLLGDPTRLDALSADGSVAIIGDSAAARSLLACCQADPVPLNG